MTSPAYAKGITGLAAYLDMDPKSARKLLQRVHIPRIVLPGTMRDTVLFRLADIDVALNKYRQDSPAPALVGVNIGALVEEIVGKEVGR